jgi:hypothetical protein
MVIGAIDQNHFNRSPAESLGGRQAAEASTNDNNTWLMLIHLFVFSFQFVKASPS